MKQDLKEAINESPMSSFQKFVLAVCIALNMLDGFDVLAVAFSAPHLAADWHLSGKELGTLLSAGLFGMAAGGLFIAPFADRIGRRLLVLLCLFAIAAGMLASAFAQTLDQLVALRVITGLGIGGMLASISVIAAEYASNKWRSGAISMLSTGYTLGATIGGAITGLLLTHYSWRSAFLFGGVCTLLIIPLALYGLPESLDFLIAKRPKAALSRVNAILKRMKRDTVNELPDADRIAQVTHAPMAGVVVPSPLMVLRTVLIWIAFVCVMAGFYFVMSWTPKLLVQAGMSASQGVTGGVLLNVGGIVGCTLFSLVSGRVKLNTLLTSFLVGSTVLLVVFGANASRLQFAMPAAIVLGAAISACVGGLYALTPLLYSPTARATGVGWAVGMGRLGAMVAPVLVGVLMDKGWQASNLYYLFAVPFLFAVLPVNVIAYTIRNRDAGVTMTLSKQHEIL
ncbi:MFS transporter [Paraburkholderia sp. CNPSo 3274]|uniref:MFS transporter n=1 Tax=Paraburkholderia sp. CNPSo 3274 TaxID=2940932 RepID=UPI0020B843C3|nr:MFS transporter [Paraburkholderia sp. CNPSo 3274]MCP3705643.1 MFS transporter [Paraburkholderia sp. CNPSo 3274]